MLYIPLIVFVNLSSGTHNSSIGAQKVKRSVKVNKYYPHSQNKRAFSSPTSDENLMVVSKFKKETIPTLHQMFAPHLQGKGRI